MNLAWKDIRHSPARFLLTAFGVAFLMTAVIGMAGLYRGIVGDALLIVDHIGADLWVVQGERSGPFAEGSAVSSTMDRRVEGVPGVAGVRRFTQFSQQFTFDGKARRATITGLDFPKDKGDWLDLTAGRTLAMSHYEAIADRSTGLAVGDAVKLGLDTYSIVGTTGGMVDSAGDGLLFVSINDAMAIAQRRTAEEVLLARAARGIDGGAATSDGSSVAQDSKIAAVLVPLDPSADPDAVKATIARWGDANVLSKADQHDLLLNARLWKLRLQILAFTILILVITSIVVSLIIYTMTIEKLHEIAMLKLIGARNSVIAGMIGGEAGLIGLIGYVLAIVIASELFSFFPRRIVMDGPDLALLALVLAVICGIGSLVGIARALKVNAREVLS
ncbi:ABC exporter transmembrane subunit, DevC protein [Hartmannibacter diazotrophicus]|uniref:ABC exporter transmembrane subunit, DevC protein n=1 Tax=Hartmannibacter diazotrophicus TaxID=1482074 RepID=A0A2C9DAY3_9HYPH|nr:ABC transporter permease [Hartmannibacter diazotrophicus]SON57484.1 ABC exporter transmembrane subunit, DevC protein [Hartmannibacter diazotrophicus]